MTDEVMLIGNYTDTHWISVGMHRVMWTVGLKFIYFYVGIGRTCII